MKIYCSRVEGHNKESIIRKIAGKDIWIRIIDSSLIADKEQYYIKVLKYTGGTLFEEAYIHADIVHLLTDPYLDNPRKRMYIRELQNSLSRPNTILEDIDDIELVEPISMYTDVELQEIIDEVLAE